MRNRLNRTILFTALAAIIMFGFSFAMAPIYTVLCKTIGLNTGKALTSSPDLTRNITIQFVTANNQNLPWDFYPLQTSIKTHPGENTKVFFHVKNKAAHQMTVQAIPSMTPPNAVKYFHKVQCFCFEQQTLDSGKSMQLPLIFQVDRNIPYEINTITLAYTLFDVTHQHKKVSA